MIPTESAKGIVVKYWLKWGEPNQSIDAHEWQSFDDINAAKAALPEDAFRGMIVHIDGSIAGQEINPDTLEVYDQEHGWRPAWRSAETFAGFWHVEGG